MPECLKISVKITFVTGHKYPPVIGFDFGDFAILLSYDVHEGAIFSTYFGKKYEDFPRMLRTYLADHEGNIENFSFRLPVETIRDIRRTFLYWQQIPYNELFSLLEKCTPRDILPIYFREDHKPR